MPRFLFVELDRHIGNADDFLADDRAVEFPLRLNLKTYILTSVKYTYLLGRVIAFRGGKMGVHVTFLKIFGQWVRIGPDGVLPLDSDPEVKDNSGDPWSQLWSLLLYVRAA
jgi:hypothetical protein